MSQPLPWGDAPANLPDLRAFGAVLFDLDGVLTPTAEVHMRAWAALFEPYLEGRGVAPYTDQDYFAFVDGKQRYQGVAQLLRSRGLELPWGEPDDPPDADTVTGLGNRKDVHFRRVLSEEGVTPYPGSLALLDLLEAAGTPVAVVSSSRNAQRVLAAAGLAARFAAVVDGASAAAEGLASKPDPATYARAAQLLGVPADRAVVVEDALSGVEAGRRGRFGLVVGDERLDLDAATLEAYERALDMAAGALERRLVWRTASGRRIEVRSRRMVSFVDKHLAVVSYTVTPLDGDASVTLRSYLLDRQEVAAGEPEPAAFDPRRAAGWRELGFRVRSGGARVGVRLEARRATFTLEEGPATSLEVRGRRV